jgi:hypothetical protein
MTKGFGLALSGVQRRCPWPGKSWEKPLETEKVSMDTNTIFAFYCKYTIIYVKVTSVNSFGACFSQNPHTNGPDEDSFSS